MCEDIMTYRTGYTVLPVRLVITRTVCNLKLEIRTVYTPSIKSALGSQCVLLPVLLGDYSKAEGESEEMDK